MEQQSASGNDEKAPENPVEEKAGNSLSSIQEEYIHELHILQGMASTAEPLKYCLQDDARLAIVHFELVTPPPDL